MIDGVCKLFDSFRNARLQHQKEFLKSMGAILGIHKVQGPCTFGKMGLEVL